MYCNIARLRPSQDLSNKNKKFGDVWLCGFVLCEWRETNILITLPEGKVMIDNNERQRECGENWENIGNQHTRTQSNVYETMVL